MILTVKIGIIGSARLSQRKFQTGPAGSVPRHRSRELQICDPPKYVRIGVTGETGETGDG